MSKRLLLLLLLAFPCRAQIVQQQIVNGVYPVVSSGPIAYVASSVAGNSQTAGTATYTVTMGASLSAGNSIVCLATDTTGINQSNTITDGDSNTYHKDKTINLATDADTFGVFHADNIAIATQNPPQVTAHGTQITVLICAAFSGLPTSSLDQNASQNTSGSSMTSTASPTLSQANELVIGSLQVAYTAGGTTTLTIGSGFTSLLIRSKSAACTSGNTCNTTAIAGMEYQIVSATTGIAGTWTYSASEEYAAVVTTYE